MTNISLEKSLELAKIDPQQLINLNYPLDFLMMHQGQWLTPAGIYALQNDHATVAKLEQRGVSLDAILKGYILNRNHDKVDEYLQKGASPKFAAKYYAYIGEDERALKLDPSKTWVAAGYALAKNHQKLKEIQETLSQSVQSSANFKLQIARSFILANDPNASKMISASGASPERIASAYVFTNQTAIVNQYIQGYPSVITEVAFSYALQGNLQNVNKLLQLGAHPARVLDGLAQACYYNYAFQFAKQYQIPLTRLAYSYGLSGNKLMLDEYVKHGGVITPIIPALVRGEHHKLIEYYHQQQPDLISNIIKAYQDAGADNFAQHYQSFVTDEAKVCNKSAVLVEEASDAILSQQVTPQLSMLTEVSIDNASEATKQTEKKDAPQLPDSIEQSPEMLKSIFITAHKFKKQDQWFQFFRRTGVDYQAMSILDIIKHAQGNTAWYSGQRSFEVLKNMEILDENRNITDKYQAWYDNAIKEHELKLRL
jgi:hypothetical protein